MSIPTTDIHLPLPSPPTKTASKIPMETLSTRPDNMINTIGHKDADKNSKQQKQYFVVPILDPVEHPVKCLQNARGKECDD